MKKTSPYDTGRKAVKRLLPSNIKLQVSFTGNKLS